MGVSQCRRPVSVRRLEAVLPRLSISPTRFGTMQRPVRASGDILLNSPDGWMGDRGPVWWVGSATGDGAIGPTGPFQYGFDAQAVVTRLVSLLVDPLTTGPFRTRRFTADDPWGRVDSAPRWLNDPHLLRPDARVNTAPVLPAPMRVPRSVFWRRFIRNAVLAGSGFLLFAEDQSGQPVAGSLMNLDPLRVRTEYDDVGNELTGRWVVGDDGEDVEFDFDGRMVGGNWRLVRLPNPHSDAGVFAQHPEVFRFAQQIESYSSGTLRSGVPAGYLKVAAPTFSKEDADRLKQAWLNAHGGDQRSIAILNATTDFTALTGISPVDAALVEVKRLNIADVAYAFGMAPETVGVALGGSMTYSNQRDWFQAHRDLSLSPWIAAMQGVLSSLLPEGTEVEINLDAYQQQTASEVIADGAAATGGQPLMTVDEWRTGRMALPPMPEPVAPVQPAETVEVVADAGA